LFKRFRSTLSSIIEKVSVKEISNKDIEPILDEILIALVENDVAYDVAEKIISGIKSSLIGLKIKRGKDVRNIIIDGVRNSILKILKEPKPLDLIEIITSVRKSGDVARLVFVGVNGVGKTTTIAKICKLLLKRGLKVVVSASDTFRAGAQEQLEIHAKRVGVPIIKHKYGSDPAAVAYDAVCYAKSRGFDAVLIDTAGRMHTDTDLMDELRKIKRIVKPHLTILVVDSLTGNDAIEQARLFDRSIGVDAVIIAKVDADVKGGVAISIVSTIGKPIMFIGTGQSYDDLEPFDPEMYVNRIVGVWS